MSECTCIKCGHCSNTPLTRYKLLQEKIKETIIEILTIYGSNLTDVVKYDLIFATWKEAGGWTWKLEDYYDTDSSYEEDYTQLVKYIVKDNNYGPMFDEEEREEFEDVPWEY